MTTAAVASETLERLRIRAEQELWPTASAVDRGRVVDQDRLAPLVDLGLLGMVAPADVGGLGFNGAQSRSVLRILGGACGATAFMFAQHHGLVGALGSTANAPLRDRWLPRLCRDTLAGTAYAHARRARQPVVAATDVGDGQWQLDGEAPWATSWGVAAVYSVAAVSEDGRLLWALVESDGTAGLSCPEPLDLLVFGGTGTARMRFDAVVVPASNVLSVGSLHDWRDIDRFLAVRPSPLALGIGDRALLLMQEAAPSTAASFRQQWEEIAERAEQASQAVDEHRAVVEEVAAVRAEVVIGVQRLTTALLSTVGGRGAELDHPAQRLAREALFYVIQAQNDDGRTATQAALRAS